MLLPDFIARCLNRFTDLQPEEKGEHPDDGCVVATPLNGVDASYVRVLEVTHQLYSLEQGDMPTTAYLHKARALADQMAAAGRPITLSEFNIFALKGLRSDFKDMVTTLAAQWVPLSFPELHSLLLSHEFIHGNQLDILSNTLHPRCSSSCTAKSSMITSSDQFFSRDHQSPLRHYMAPEFQNCGNHKDQIADISSNTLHTSYSPHNTETSPLLPASTIDISDYFVNGDHQPPPKTHINLPDFQSCGNNPRPEAMAVSKSIKVENKNLEQQKDQDDNTWIRRDDFPGDFVFGTATSSYQFEGAAAQGGRGLSVWDIFTLETPDRIFDGSNGNTAVDMYNRYKEDIAMMKKMGLDACRISISWSRVLPGGRLTAGINREGIKFYNDLIDCFLASGIEPYVTLFHWDLPYCLEKEYGGFLNQKIVEDFRDFAELCFWEFGDRVKSWITLNEPWSYCTSGYVTGKFPPSKAVASAEKIGKNFTTYRAIHDPKVHVPTSNLGSDEAKDAYIVAKNLLVAHAAAVHSYRTKFQEHQEGKIGIVLCCQWYEPYVASSTDDIVASKRAMDFMMGWYLEPVLYGKYPQSMTDFVPSSNLPEFSEEESELLKGSIDFLGLNYYTANYVANDNHPNSEQAYYKDQRVAFHTERDGKPIGALGGSTWLYVVPWGVHKLLTHIKNTYPNIPPIYITENGLDEKSDCRLTAYDVCRDKMRVKYHQDHLAYILKAIQEGVEVKGYFIWSWCDNFEWYEGYTVRFGIVYIDFINNLARYPKSSAVWYAKFLKKRSGNRSSRSIVSSE